MLVLCMLVFSGIGAPSEMVVTFSEPQSHRQSPQSVQVPYEYSLTPPPFQAPPSNTTTELSGSQSGLDWRLFSPQPDAFNPGDFRVCFDISCNVVNGMTTLLVILKNEEETYWYWNEYSRLSNQVIDNGDGTFQFQVWSNSTYWYINMSCLEMAHPVAEDHVHCVIAVVYEYSHINLVNITVFTSMIPPDVAVLADFDDDYTMLALATDTNGIRRAYVAGYDTSGPSGHFILAENDTVESGEPFVLRMDRRALWHFLCSTGREGHRQLTFSAFLSVTNNASMETRLDFGVSILNSMLNVSIVHPYLNELTRVCDLDRGDHLLVHANDTDGVCRAFLAGYDYISDYAHEPVGVAVLAENDTAGWNGTFILRINQEALWDFIDHLDQEDDQTVEIPVFLSVTDNSNTTTRIYFVLMLANVRIEQRQYLILFAAGLLLACVIISLERHRRKRAGTPEQSRLEHEQHDGVPPYPVGV